MLMEPSVAALGGGSPARVAKRLFLATRPMFFPASILPVLVGSAWGWRAAQAFDGEAFALALLAIVCVHAGVNVLNDVYDELCGTDPINRDRIYPYSGGSRFIQNGVMSLGGMGWWGVTLLALATALGVLLLAVAGTGVLYFGLAGMALGVLYSLPPVQLSARGLGEVAVGVGFGMLPVTGAAWLQSGEVHGEALLLSLPVALWVANILLVNEVPDAGPDAQAGKRTLVVRLGLAGTRRLYLVVNALAVLGVALAVVAEILAPLALVVPVGLGLVAARAAQGLAPEAATRTALTRTIKATLGIHALGGLWLAGWTWAG